MIRENATVDSCFRQLGLERLGGSFDRSCGKSREEGRTKRITICSRFTKNMNFPWSETTMLELTFYVVGERNKTAQHKFHVLRLWFSKWRTPVNSVKKKKTDSIPSTSAQMVDRFSSAQGDLTLEKNVSADWRTLCTPANNKNAIFVTL